MVYEPLAELVEKNTQEVVRKTAETVVSRKLGRYAEFRPAQLAQFFVPTMQMVVRYLRKGNVNEWREFLVNTSRDLYKRGYATEDVNAATVILAAKIIELIERKMPGPENAELRIAYVRKIESLRTIAKVSIVNTHILKGAS
jgi:hypothetical protein